VHLLGLFVAVRVCAGDELGTFSHAQEAKPEKPAEPSHRCRPVGRPYRRI